MEIGLEDILTNGFEVMAEGDRGTLMDLGEMQEAE